MPSIRVMQTFGAPRTTTNPYIVQLAHAIEADPRITHVPFSWRSALIEPLDVVHVHWADAVLAGRTPLTRLAKRVAFALFVARVRLFRIPVVRTVHNLTEPSVGPVDRALVRALIGRTTLRIHLSPTTPDEEGTPAVLIEHGHYINWFGQYRKSDAVTGRIGYAGLLKAYKGIDRLLSAFSESHMPGLSLRVAGKPADAQTDRFVRERVASLPRAEADLRYISEAELVTLVTSSELIVLPYIVMHNSGAALAALSLERPILVPDNPTNRALANEVGPGWVHLFQGELTAQGLDDAIQDLRASPPTQKPRLDNREWTHAGRRHVDAYLQAMTLNNRHRKDLP
ncbi:glycosyl transferase [Microbacterium sp. ARD32]|uniref:glycosyl transferase n=1 Tax=Microbacterium sp. ARD32 TaxID=2962577 RepID=UPI002882CF14|nr:glycosyl transferase [Microbacterium sp. ARD32]MDT0156335.1 glycosyl transferase [Microbacterium sp. ARD32]